MTDPEYQRNIRADENAVILQEMSRSIVVAPRTTENRAESVTEDSKATTVKKNRNDSDHQVSGNSPVSAWRRASEAIATIFRSGQRSSINPPRNDDQESGGNLTPDVVIQDPKNPSRGPRNPNRQKRNNHDPRLEDLSATDNPLIPGLNQIISPPAIPILISTLSEEDRIMRLKMPPCSASAGLRRTSGSSESKRSEVKASAGRASSKAAPNNVNYSQNKTENFEELEGQITAGSLIGYSSKLDRGLRRVSRKPEPLSNPNAKTKLVPNRNLLPVALENAGGALGIGGLRESPTRTIPQDDKADKPLDPSSKSMRQLYSMADSWSSDSVTSHSDICSCCHNNEFCPIHGKANITQK
ncbi:uncharacterized protein LOC124407647 [Diprion similis]|uniref:uncharacterized protein LOC124407647 n=1 Tax=Diprion similis TaxID=362088 RepID=UPI001EF81388|nr:uncharacterized protein LOC124407647 [Diprion similis]